MAVDLATMRDQHIDVDFVGKFGMMPAQDATPLSLVLTELITNSVEHGFEGRKEGHITISVGRGGNNLNVVVEDDGTGLADEEHDGMARSSGSGLGTQIINTFVTNDFGGTLYEHIGKSEAIELMKYVDDINMEYGGEGTKLYSTAGTKFKKLCLQNKLNLLDASVRHLGTDINYVVLQNLYEKMKDHVDFYFDASVDKVEKTEDGYAVFVGDERYEGTYCIISAGRSGSKWMETVCTELKILSLIHI